MPLAATMRRGAASRAAGSVAVGALAALGLSLVASPLVAAMSGWDAGGVLLLSRLWFNIWRADPEATRSRAGAEDPGRTPVYVLVLLSSTVSLFAAVALARYAHGLDAGIAKQVVLLSLVTVAVSWSLTHTAFTLRYAHLYYREDDNGIGGLELPGHAPPDYMDFAYFSFTVGMAFQVSDVAITSRQIRRTVLLHAGLSFAYNTAIVAFALNLAFGFSW